MVIDIGDTGVSIPVAISDWAHESEDNMTELNGMIEAMMYAVNKTMKERYNQGPYQKVYEKQLEELKEMGMDREAADSFIQGMIDTAMNKDSMVAIKELFGRN